MTTAIMTVTLWMSATKEPAITGPVTRYDPGLMEQVAVNRHLIESVDEYDTWLRFGGYDGGVALDRCGDLRRTVWIRGERFMVMDCRQRDHFPGPFVAEVDYQTAQRWLSRGPWPSSVVVWFWRPAWRVGAR